MKSTIHIVLSEIGDPARRALVQKHLDIAIGEITRLDPEVGMRIHEDHESYISQHNPLCGHEGDGAYDRPRPAQ